MWRQMKEDKVIPGTVSILLIPMVDLRLSPGLSGTERKLQKLLKEAQAKLQVPWSISGPTEGRDCQRLPRDC